MIEEKSLDVFAEKLAKLRELFPEVLSEGKIDFKRLQSVLGEEAFFHKEHYELSWAGKSDARAQIQKTTSATLIPTGTIGAADSHNIFVEGENLEVLHVLQRAYFGKIKMIYIDPPYNTGNDSFVYPDDYSERQDEYKKRAGITDENGFLNKQDCWKKNSKENGQFHSVWLSMMYPRLYLARNLLREDGVIFISIDDNEQANLKLLCDEIFGAENFIAEFIWKKKQGRGNDSRNIVIEHEKILCFCKNVDAVSFLLDKNHELDDALYPFKDEKGEYGLVTLDKSSIRFSDSLVFEIKSPDGISHLPRIIKGKQSCWRWGKDKVLTDYDQLVFKNGNVYTKYYRPTGVTPKSLLIDSRFGRTETGKDDIKKLFNNMEFSYPKPVNLISHFSLISSQDNDIILDFFAGSGTTAHAVLDLNEQDDGNRQFICVQMPELLDETSEAYKAGYRTIADICKTRITKVVEKIQTERDSQKQAEIPAESKQVLGFKSFKLAPSNFKQWRSDVDEADILAQLELFKDSEQPHSENEAMLVELLLKAGLSLTTKFETHTVAEQAIYSVKSDKLLFFFDDYNESVKDFIFTLKPKRVVCLNRVFKNDDQALTCFKLGLKDAGCELQII